MSNTPETTGSKAPEIRKGLYGVVVDETKVSKVVPETNSLTYRGYPVQELARYCSFEEVAYLLWNGRLPKQESLVRFSAREKALRHLDRHLIDLITSMPKSCHPMDVLRTAVSFLGAQDAEAYTRDSEPRAPDRAGAHGEVPHHHRPGYPAPPRRGLHRTVP